jgi:hypothetical protein
MGPRMVHLAKLVILETLEMIEMQTHTLHCFYTSSPHQSIQAQDLLTHVETQLSSVLHKPSGESRGVSTWRLARSVSNERVARLVYHYPLTPRWTKLLAYIHDKFREPRTVLRQ